MGSRTEERLGKPPQGNQELLMVKDKVVNQPSCELGVSKSMECENFSLQCSWHCWLGDRKGIWPVKSWVWFLGGDDL